MSAPKSRSAHVWEREPDNHYVEPTWVTRRLCETERFEGRTIDPCAGFGHTIAGAAEAGVTIEGFDLRDRGRGSVIGGRDWFADPPATHGVWGCENIISNPPYGRNKRGIPGERARLANAMEKLDDRLKEINERPRDDMGFDFEAMGVDYLAIDEMHEFKNLQYATAGERVVGMNDPAGSQKAFDLYVKVRGLTARGGGVAGATGTPVSNSLVAAYTIMKYLAHDALAERNQLGFDAWSAAYAVTETRMEYTATQTLKPRRVLARLGNLDALGQLYRGFADVISMDDIKRIYAAEVKERNRTEGKKGPTAFPVPKVKGGGRQLRSAPLSAGQLSGNELGAWEDIRQLGRKASAWYRAKLVPNGVGASVINKDTGWTITFTVTGARKVGGRKGDVLYRLVPALREIVTFGALVSSAPDGRGRPNVKAVHKLAATVLLDGQPRDVIVTVMETTDGHYHYDLSADSSDGARLQRASIGQAAYGLEDDPAPINLEIVDHSVNAASPIFNPRDARKVNADLIARLRALGIEIETLVVQGTGKARRAGRQNAGARRAAMRAAFESGRLPGPYFPLARFGNYFVTVRGEDGSVTSFSRFETRATQEAFRSEMEAEAPGRVEAGVLDAQDLDLKSMVDPAFAAQVIEALEGSGADDAMLDTIWQTWLETLPDQSIRKSKIHRKGRAGFSTDAFRAFGKGMFHGAHQLARLKFGLKMGDVLDQAAEEAAKKPDAERAGFVVQEMKRRHAFAMNPRGNPLTSWLTGLGFIWYLGMSPAAALVNLSQTTMIAPAVLGARHPKAGVTGAARELTRAMRDFTVGKGQVAESARLTDEEKAAMAEAYRRGTVDRTQSHDLAGVADSGVEYFARRERVMRVIGFMFHHTERMNREVTFLAAYRLARKDGMSHEAAVEAASNGTWESHFSYQNSDRPRIMQGDVAKVALLFRSYSVNMLWRLFRDSHQALVGASAEDRREARTQLIGISLSMMAHAGIKGTWGFGILMTLLGIFFPGGDDDAEKWLQDALLMEGDDLGTAAWNFAMGAALVGVPGWVAGVDLTSRIGMPNLWWRDSGRDLDAKDSYAALTQDLLGPVAGIGANWFEAAALATEDPARALEKAVPKWARDPLKAWRYASEGVTTRNGDEIVQDVNPFEVIATATGFTPGRIAERYEVNNRLKNAEGRITRERQRLHRDVGDAIKGGEGLTDDLRAQVQDFNRRYPEFAITSETLRASMRARAQASARNEGGVSLNAKLDPRLRESEAVPVYR